MQIGDKPPRFCGSREWIGSTEVGLLVESFTGHGFRILMLGQGECLSSKVPVFAQHFREHRGPIMAGGLGTSAAQTIIGVGWEEDGTEDDNEEGGAPCFLVLDPHYTGPDRLDAVQASGGSTTTGCHWVPLSWWQRGVDRYFCLPSADKATAVTQTIAADSPQIQDEWTFEITGSGFAAAGGVER